MNKRILALLLAAMMLVGLLAGCNNGNQPAAGGGDLNVGVFYYNFADAYISTVRNNMDKQLKDAGITFTNYDANTNQGEQINQINTAITNGANLLIVNVVENSSPDAAQQIADIAKEKDIPVIFFNRDFDASVVQGYAKSAFVGTDPPEAGHMQGEMIGDYLVANWDAADLNGDGKISYVMFKGQEGNVEADARTQYGVEDANLKLTAAGKPELEFYDASNPSKYLVDTAGNWSAQAATDYMTTILASYSTANNNMVELVICNNDAMAEGAVSALQAAGYNTGNEGDTTIPVYGVDALDSTVQLIKEGKVAGTIKQDAEGMASTIMTLVNNVKDGKDLMAGTENYNIDADAAKIRVPYAKVDITTAG